MRVDALIPCPGKRRRLMSSDPMEADIAKAKLADIAQKLGREIRVFETLATSLTPDEVSNREESDGFYEFSAEDYYRILATRKEDKFLKTRKIREAEEAARRSRITKAVIRVRFPDNFTLEAKFHPSESFQSLVDLLMKVIARPDLPFYIYTTPPKKQIKDMSQDFYSAGFAPGAIVYFSYNLPEGSTAEFQLSLSFQYRLLQSCRRVGLLLPFKIKNLPAASRRKARKDEVDDWVWLAANLELRMFFTTS
ncbi:hypothetical protein HHK36_032853 [Tetracentron sinense]|uniref:UBX domain-containing protein n=1 Tax=Tetracentron sinense TaxID=13715 RepID=A0A834Y698_TETSI|nr:hypothetical protein HHK36_032853 [Tetracentron sinense]